MKPGKGLNNSKLNLTMDINNTVILIFTAKIKLSLLIDKM